MKQTSLSVVQHIITILVQNGNISGDNAIQLTTEYLDDQDALIDFLLVDGIADRRTILEALSSYYDVPWCDVTGNFFEHTLVHLFPKDFLLRNGIIPLEEDNDELIMVAANPTDDDMLPIIGNYVSYDIQFQVGIRRDIEDAVKEFHEQAITLVEDDSDLAVERRDVKEEQQIEEENVEKTRGEE